MSDLKILEDLIKDYKTGIEFIHNNVIMSYQELKNLRNKKFQVEKLLKSLKKKNNK